MSTTINHSTFRLRQIGALAVILFLSITLPIGILCWFVKSAMSGKPLRRASSEFKNYSGILHGGELWFPVLRYSLKEDPSSYSGEWRIMRLDLETGVERETGLGAFKERCWPCVVNGEVYRCGPDTVYKMDGSTLVKVTSYDAQSPWHGEVFEFNGQLTNAVETSDGEFQLCHVVNSQWVNGRKFHVPRRGSVWIGDPHFRLQLPQRDVLGLRRGNGCSGFAR